MKTFLMEKMNILLSILLVGVLGASGVVGYNLFIKNSSVTVPDFLGKDKQEVIVWCGQLSDSEACEFIYEETSNTEKDKVFQQSISAGKKLEGKITFNISSGIAANIDAPVINDNTTRQDIENWKSENQIATVNYVEENSDTLAAGKIIRIEPASDIKKETIVTVFVSKGKKDDSSSGEGKIEVKSNAYINLTVAQFEAKAKELGLVANHRSSNDAGSSSVTKGNIVWHGSGIYEKGETINYGICTEESKGISVKEGAYVGKSESEFKTIAEGLKLKPVHNSDWDEKTSDTAKVGTVCAHGYSNNYSEGEDFRYGLYKSDSSSSTIKISQDQYKGKTEDEFKTIANDLGLKPNHDSGRDSYSSSIAKGSIITHGYGTYVKGETFNYGLSLGSENGSSNNSEIIVKAGQYIGKTENEFKNIASELGLKANHKTTLDKYSTTIAKGSVVGHGSGTYEKDEEFNYGLSLGTENGGSSSQTIQISQGQYVGKSETDFINAAKALGLTPTHIEGRDAYSSSIAKGNIVTHGFGSYVKNEAFNYGLSLGPEPVAEKVNVESKSGSTEAAFKSYLEGLGMKAGNRSEAYSSTIASGLIISNDSGSYTKGSSINYTVSLGQEPETLCVLNAFSDLASLFLATDDYDAARNNAIAYLDKAGFTNYSIVGEKSLEEGEGALISITVNGVKHVTRATYPSGASIVVTISTGYPQG